MNMKIKSQGFSLVEIMMVMAIVSLLVSIAIVEGVKLRQQANESNCQANLKTIATGFEVYAARHGGLYAQQEENNLQFLVDDATLGQDLVSLGQLGSFNYVVNSIGPGGYDILALAVNQTIASHNYRITTGGRLRRSNTSAPGDLDFQDF